MGAARIERESTGRSLNSLPGLLRPLVDVTFGASIFSLRIGIVLNHDVGVALSDLVVGRNLENR